MKTCGRYERTSLHRALVERGITRDGGDERHPGLHRVRVGAARKPTWVLDVGISHPEHALRGPSPQVHAERQAAAEAEAEDAAKVIASKYGDGAYPAKGGTT
jgi:hypothetical protein